jgi:hypothetical protein
MIALLWGRLQGTVAAIALVVGAIFSAWIVGRKTGGERVRAQAAAHEQEVRGKADEAARTAERTGAFDRLRDGRF